MLKYSTIIQSLCYFDIKSPSKDLVRGDKPKVCFCINCENGKNDLAVEILRLMKYK